MRRLLGTCPDGWLLCGHNGSPRGSVMSCQSLAPARAFAAPPAVPAPDKEPLACGAFHRSVRFSSESQPSRHGSTDVDCRREAPGSISLTALPATPGGTSSGASSMSQSAPSASSTFCELPTDGAPQLPSGGCRFPKLEECAHFHYERVSLGGLSVELVREDEDCSGEHHSLAGLAHSGTGDGSEGGDDRSNSECREGWVTLRVRSHVTHSSREPDTSLTSGWSGAGLTTAPLGDDGGGGLAVGEWMLTRSAENFRMLDGMLHRCIYDRKVSGLSNLSTELKPPVVEDRREYESLISDYLHHFSIIADDTINCGPILNWLQMDNKGHRLLVANEDSTSINTPAVAAAYSVRRYVSQARDEISFEVGDMISVIDMPGPQESIWWRGKRGFRVGFFPHHCVAVIGDKVPRHMTQPPPIVGSVAVAPIKPVLRKHGKLISLFRSFILARPSRRSLKQQGILRERVFGCDLGEHLLNSAHDVPLVLSECSAVIERHGVVDGIYRLSGASSLTQRLRLAFDEGRAPPDLAAAPVLQDVHAVASLLKMYFRELPNPLCTYQLYECFVGAVQMQACVTGGRRDDANRLRAMRHAVVKLPPPHYRTLSYLMRHLRRMSLQGAATGMTARNMAIVWAPNLLRSPRAQHALQGVAVQAVVTEFLICYAEELFTEDQDADPQDQSSSQEGQPASLEAHGDSVEVREQGHHQHGPVYGDGTTGRRPKSLPLATPTKLLSLEEARNRGGLSSTTTTSSSGQPTSTSSGTSGSSSGQQQAVVSSGGVTVNNVELRPSVHKEPKYIEVGSGPNNLPQYHTVIELPSQGPKRGLKRSPSGWRGLFFRSTKQPAPATRCVTTISTAAAPHVTAVDALACPGAGGALEVGMQGRRQVQSCVALGGKEGVGPVVVRGGVECKDMLSLGSGSLRPVKSCESLQSESDLLAPLSGGIGTSQPPSGSKQHSRSASCDSYFEPWQAELAGMRLRLSPQERDGNIFSEEDDTTLNTLANGGTASGIQSWQAPSVSSSPVTSDVEPSPRKALRPAPPRPSVAAAVASAVAMDVDGADRKRTKIEDQLGDIKYIDCGTPEHTITTEPLAAADKALVTTATNLSSAERPRVTMTTAAVKGSPEKRHSGGGGDIDGGGDGGMEVEGGESGEAKRLCKSRDNGAAAACDTFASSVSVKLRERSSPRKNKSTSRYSNLHHPVSCILPPEPTATTTTTPNDTKIITIVNHLAGQPNRVSWHGGPKTDSHSTLIKIDWPAEESNSLTASTLNSSPLTPVTPIYDLLESDSEISEAPAAMQNIRIPDTANVDAINLCVSCSGGKKCLKCELTECTKDMDYENVSSKLQKGIFGVKSIGVDDSNLLNVESPDSNPTDSSPTNITYENLNRLSNISTNSSNTTTDETNKDRAYENVEAGKENAMTSSHESSSSYSNVSPTKHANDELYECFNFSRPNYINLQSSNSSKSSSTSPLKSPLRSTISITFKSPTKIPKTNSDEYEPIETPTNSAPERDSVYEDVDLEKNLSIVEDAQVPDSDASLPTQQACQPTFTDNLIILESPVNERLEADNTSDDVDVYSQVKIFRKSIDEINAMIFESELPEEKKELKNAESVYENVDFNDGDNVLYENVDSNGFNVVNTGQKDLTECRKFGLSLGLNTGIVSATNPLFIEAENGNVIAGNGKGVKSNFRANLNVRQLANKFESPTEAKGPFNFERASKGDIKYPTLERKSDTSSIDRARSLCETRSKKDLSLKIPPPVSPKTYKLCKNSTNARSLDENAFVKEFGFGNKKYSDRRKSFEVREAKKQSRFVPDLNLNLDAEEETDERNSELNQPQYSSITPTTENKISLVQARFSSKENKPNIENLEVGSFEGDKKLSRERIEKYKEERRNFLREKYSSQSFRSSSPSEQLMRLKAVKRNDENQRPFDNDSGVELRNPEKYDRLFSTVKDDETANKDLPKFERRNTVDLGQRMRFSVSVGNNKCANNSLEGKGQWKVSAENNDRRVREGGMARERVEDAGSSDVDSCGSSSRVESEGRKESGSEDSDGRMSSGSSAFERKDKRSPSFNIRDMAALFEQKSQHGTS